MFKYIIVLVTFISIGCNQKSTTTTYTAKGEETIILPDAESSWYIVKTDSFTFRGKGIALFSGELTAEDPQRKSSINIDVLKGVDIKDMKWQAALNVYNQQLFSASMVNPQVFIKVNDKLSFMLTGLDNKSVFQILTIQENFGNRMWDIINGKQEIKNMYAKLEKEPGNQTYVKGMSLLDWLPELYRYDGPSFNPPKQDTVGVYLTGYAKGKKMLNFWLTIYKEGNSSKIVFNARLSHKKSGAEISKFTMQIDPNTKLFWADNWITHTEFTNFRKLFHPGKPVPSLLLRDAGVIIRTALIGSNWASDIQLGNLDQNYILIRSDIFDLAFPPGQIVNATVGDPIF